MDVVLVVLAKLYVDDDLGRRLDDRIMSDPLDEHFTDTSLSLRIGTEFTRTLSHQCSFNFLFKLSRTIS